MRATFFIDYTYICPKSSIFEFLVKKNSWLIIYMYDISEFHLENLTTPAALLSKQTIRL